MDAKTPMDAYLTAVESDVDADRQDAFKRHARQVRERAQDLSQKSYQQRFDKTPDFVVSFCRASICFRRRLRTTAN